jgi:hypothetical protein
VRLRYIYLYGESKSIYAVEYNNKVSKSQINWDRLEIKLNLKKNNDTNNDNDTDSKTWSEEKMK